MLASARQQQADSGWRVERVSRPSFQQHPPLSPLTLFHSFPLPPIVPLSLSLSSLFLSFHPFSSFSLSHRACLRPSPPWTFPRALGEEVS